MKNDVNLVANGELFFTGDGVTSSANLEIGGSTVFEPSNVVINSIFITDWQGYRPLYNFARTSIGLHTEDITGWTSTNVTLANATGVRGDGGQMIKVLETTTNAAHHAVSPAFAAGANTAYVVTLLLKPTLGRSYFHLQLNGSVYNATTNYINLDLSSVGVITGYNGTVAAPIVTKLADGSFKVQYRLLTGAVTPAPFSFVDVYTCQDATFVVSFAGNAADGVYVCYMAEQASAFGGYIAAAASATVFTDYTYSNDLVSFGFIPQVNAPCVWWGTVTGETLDASATLLAQYANSPRITALVDYVNQWIDPSIDIDNFYNYIWNVQTARGFGLDIWGKIVNIPRKITIIPLPNYLGFEEALPGSFPFNQQPMYGGTPATNTYELTDDAYRVLIMTKALANISSFTAPSINALLSYLFADKPGTCYCQEIGPMSIEYVFNFALEPWEASVIQQPSLMPRPAGVALTIVVNA